MNITETLDAQNRAIVRLQTENANLLNKIAVLNMAIGATELLLSENNELKKENQKLTDMTAKAVGVQQHRKGKNIDAGIGEISYSCSGSIDLQELMDTLEKCIKNNGVRDTIRILAMAV